MTWDAELLRSPNVVTALDYSNPEWVEHGGIKPFKITSAFDSSIKNFIFDIRETVNTNNSYAGMLYQLVSHADGEALNYQDKIYFGQFVKILNLVDTFPVVLVIRPARWIYEVTFKYKFE